MQNIELSARHLELIRQLTRGCTADQVLDLVIAMLEVAHARRELEWRRDRQLSQVPQIRLATDTLWHAVERDQDI